MSDPIMDDVVRYVIFCTRKSDGYRTYCKGDWYGPGDGEPNKVFDKVEADVELAYLHSIPNEFWDRGVAKRVE